jgi:hypothetical protein
VDYEILLAKLKFYGVQGTFLKLIASYLNNRYQKVVINDKLFCNWLSNWERIKGSVLGPLFFLLYINDLPAVISNMSKPTLFADDVNLILVSPDFMQLKSNLEAVFEKILDWFQANLLTLKRRKNAFYVLQSKNESI